MTPSIDVLAQSIPGGLPQPSAAMAGVAAVVAAVVVFTGVRVATAPESASAVGGFSAEQLAALAPARAPLERDFARMAEAEGRDPRPKVTAFGDSVLLGASGALEGTFNVELHAQVAEQAAEMKKVIAREVEQGEVRDMVVLHVGNNGIITEEQLRGMLEALSPAEKVALVNVRVPRSWREPNNALMASVASDFPNVVLVDWAKASADHRDYMVKDGVHLTSKGAKAYTALIAEALGVDPEQ